MTTSTSPVPGKSKGGLAILLLCLVATLTVLFFRSLDMGQALFANDGPYGVLMSNLYKMPAGFFGVWNDLFWLGANNGTFSPNATGLLLFGLGRRMFVNFYTPCTALLVGLCAWFFFRQLRFNAMASVLGALAAALNMNFFSNACWGLGTRNTALACTFLALAAVESSFAHFSWLKLILAGLAIGMSISEGGDNGAIFSVFVAGYAFCRSLQVEETVGSRVLKGGARVALIAVVAAIMAFPSLLIFRDTAVKGVVGSGGDGMSPAQKWDWATQWSLPKAETLRVIIPGIFGYRLDTEDGGNYWGRVGQQPGWEEHHQGFPRHSGAGEYAGVTVVLIALWALANSLVRTGGAYDEKERRIIWFWGGAGLVALLLAWGRHAPFYQVLYALPYFSTIRNPMKFMHPLHMTLMILFAYGVMGLGRRYLQGADCPKGVLEQFKSWWNGFTGFDKRWAWGSIAAVAAAVLGWLIYNASQPALIQVLAAQGFEGKLGRQIAQFGAKEVLLFALFLAASVLAVLAIMSRAFAGRRAVWAGLLLGLVLVVDLYRADKPWVRYSLIADKYATNPVLDALRNKPHEHRVTVPNFQVPPQAAQLHGLLQQVYQIEWLQHHFQLFNIQAMEVAQMPRVPEDYAAFNRALAGQSVRLWQLCNTRYVLALAGFNEALNAQFDPQKRRFRNTLLFEINQLPGGGVTAVTNNTGPFSLIEFTGALPRAALYPAWQVSTNDEAALKRLAEPSFEPEKQVLVTGNVGVSTSADAPAAPVEIVNYSPRRIEMAAKADAASVLLLNNRYDAGWKVTVDGKPAELLRCNFIMQGVQVPPGSHQIVFRFSPPKEGFWLMSACVGVALLLCGFLALFDRPRGA